MSSEKVEGYLGSEHMSSFQRQAASCHLLLSFARLSRRQKVLKLLWKAWGQQKSSTFSWKGQDIVTGLISMKDFTAPAWKCPVTGFGKEESTHCHGAAAASGWSTQTLHELCDAPG